jgi:NAD(P)-dependent dehydrogenase (short-subunit alcohol dehydrogenase family)
MAERFAREGMTVVMADIEESPLETAANDLRHAGAKTVTQRVDVSDAAGVAALAETVYKRFGAVHLLCNNAGVIGEGTPSWEESLEAWDWVMGVNFRGVLHGIHSFVPRMIDGGQPGHIVNTASVAGLTTRPLMASYNVSKHAVVALSECLHAELQLTTDQLRVSVLCPAFSRTRLAESNRNRPGASGTLADPYGFHKAWRSVVEEGTPPEAIAEHVYDAVRQKRFWILPHTSADKTIRERFETMLRRENPALRDLRPEPTRLR